MEKPDQEKEKLIMSNKLNGLTDNQARLLITGLSLIEDSDRISFEDEIDCKYLKDQLYNILLKNREGKI